MTPSPASEEPIAFDLSAGGPALVLEDEGFRMRVGGRLASSRAPLQRYEDVTHLGLSARGVWIATRRHIQFLRRNRFRQADGPELAAREVVRRIGQRPGGMRQLQRIAEVDHRAREGSHRRVTIGVVLICVAVHFLQLRDPFVLEAGSFVPGLVALGELWRIFTANVIHGLAAVPVHLGFNLIGLIAFSTLVERPLGALRTALVYAAAVVGGIGACAFAGYDEVVGASTLVAGLVGAAMCLEFHHPDKLPTWWRLPRRPFVIVVLGQALLDQWFPFIAAAAHIGGFAGGYLAAWMLAPSAFSGRAAPRWAAPAAAIMGLAAALSLAALTPLLTRDADALDRYARHLLQLPELPPGRYNDLAWRMVTESDPRPDQLAHALALAERAVDGTGRMDPDLLDTLAEVHFARGEPHEAVEVIDEAIRLSPLDEYFREQRRRFTGDRESGDRPEPPELPWLFRRDPNAPEPGWSEEGLRV